MSEYQLAATDSYVIRSADGALIPDDPGNADRIAYQAWLAAGGVPDPHVPSPPQAAPESTVLYDHENRLRAIEGQPPLSLQDFITKVAT